MAAYIVLFVFRTSERMPDAKFNDFYDFALIIWCCQMTQIQNHIQYGN